MSVYYVLRKNGITLRDFMTLEGCHETSVRNYHYSLRNIPEKEQFSSGRTLLMEAKFVSETSVD
jgi:hypothetical protein